MSEKSNDYRTNRTNELVCTRIFDDTKIPAWARCAKYSSAKISNVKYKISMRQCPPPPNLPWVLAVLLRGLSDRCACGMLGVGWLPGGPLNWLITGVYSPGGLTQGFIKVGAGKGVGGREQE